jgi:hypothetical protein
MSTLRFATVFGMSLTILSLCSCKETEKNKISSTADRAAQAVGVGLTNWAMTNGTGFQRGK